MKLSVSRVRVFGSDCFVHVPDVDRIKLDPKAQRAIHVGYSTNGGWRVLSLTTGKVVSSRDVTFSENQFSHRGAELSQALRVADAYEEVEEEQLDNIISNLSFERQMQIALAESRNDARKVVAAAAAAEAPPDRI